MTPKPKRAARIAAIGAQPDLGSVERALAIAGIEPRTVTTALLPFTDLPDQLVADQAGAVLGWADAIHLGDVGKSAGVLAEGLTDCARPVVFDPCLVDGEGQPTRARAVVEAVKTQLVKQAEVLVVNAAEAALFTGRPVRQHADLREAGKRLFDLGVRWILLAGGRLEPHAVDWLYDGADFQELGADRRAGAFNGAGVLYSAALAAALARGMAHRDAAQRAKAVVTAAIDGALDGRVEPLAIAWAALNLEPRAIEVVDAT